MSHWRERAECLGHPEIMIAPEGRDSGWHSAPARKLCDACTVTEECLNEWAIWQPQIGGIAAGMNDYQLTRMRKAMGITPIPHPRPKWSRVTRGVNAPGADIDGQHIGEDVNVSEGNARV